MDRLHSALVALLFLLAGVCSAREWQAISIPDAYCGDGLPYRIYFSAGDPNRLAVEMMGGGACWSASTCYGPKLRTWLHPIPKAPMFSYMGLAKDHGPLKDHTMIFLPYCTGDVHAGDHLARYALGLTVRHFGYQNIVKSVQFAHDHQLVDFKNLDEFILYGSSAGAIGSFIHTKTFGPYLGIQTKKILIADSPGLHFGENFWHKFSPEMRDDFRKSFNRIGLYYSDDNGLVAPYIPDVCKELDDWHIGILQSTKDLIMALVFGEQPLEAHRRLILSEDGILARTKDVDNCAAWVNDSKMHTFLLLKSSAQMRAGGLSAIDFFSRIVRGQTNRNFAL